MRNFLLGALAGIIALAALGWLCLRLGVSDLRADARPSWFEARLAVMALDASVARHAPLKLNPLPPSDANLMAGAILYRDKCADCHGRPDNPDSDYGRSFYPRVPQFMKEPPDMEENQDFFIIKHGVRWTAMPAWGQVMADSEIWQVVTFLTHLQHLPPAVQLELRKPAGSGS